MKNAYLRVSLTTAIGAIGIASLSGCSANDQNSISGNDTVSGVEVCTSVENDLKEAQNTITDWMAQKGDLKEIMLASDVQSPTQKYGMWVVPYQPSEAVKKFSSKVTIDGGKYVFTAIDAESGVECGIDQDGSITEIQ